MSDRHFFVNYRRNSEGTKLQRIVIDPEEIRVIEKWAAAVKLYGSEATSMFPDLRSKYMENLMRSLNAEQES